MSHRIPPSLDEADALTPVDVGRWYVVYAKVRGELRAAHALRAAGLEVYLPQLTTIVRHARKAERVERPLFPRYFFVKLSDVEPEFHAVRQVRDIECLVGVCGAPRPIHGRFVYDLQQAEAAGEFDETGGESERDPYKAGDQIRVKVGSKFAGWPGKVIRMTEDQRVAVLIRGMGGKDTSKTFNLEELEMAA